MSEPRFKIGDHVEKFTGDYVARGVVVGDIVSNLRGKNLACWCKPGEPCHADVLLEIANRPIKCEATS